MNENAEKFMREAIKQAKKAAAKGEVPVGAVIVRNGEIVSRAYNTRETGKNALCHSIVYGHATYLHPSLRLFYQFYAKKIRR